MSAIVFIVSGIHIILPKNQEANIFVYLGEERIG